MKQNTKPLSELIKFRSPLSTSELTFENEHQYQKRVVMEEGTTEYTKRVAKRKEDKVIERVTYLENTTEMKRALTPKRKPYEESEPSMGRNPLP